MLRPNFFIAGAPKCGTTAFGVYLGQHPEIFMTVPKEPFFYSTDLPGLRKVETEAQYLELFARSADGQRFFGEASTLYLYSREAAAHIRRAGPASKLIVMLRSPVDIVRSYHSQMLYGLFEDEPDLRRAWELQSERRQGRSIPRLCPEPGVLQYGEIARLGSQLERLLTVFPREQVHCVVFDDFVNDPSQAYRGALGFLGAADDGRTDFPRVNPNKVYRFRTVARIKRHVFKNYPAVERTLRWVVTATGMHGPAHRVVSKKVAHQPIPEDLRKSLNRYYEPEVALLSQLLDRDLSHWTHHDAERQ